MTEHHDRDELVELMSRYANMPDTQNWDELPRWVFCDEITCDFSALGAPVTTISRDAWCQRTKQAFAGWTATHHAISNLRIAIDGDRATIQAHICTGLPPRSRPADRTAGWMVGFYDDVAARTPEGWRLSSVKLTLSHQENEALLAATPDPVEPDDEGEAPPLLGLAPRRSPERCSDGSSSARPCRRFSSPGSPSPSQRSPTARHSRRRRHPTSCRWWMGSWTK
jgi:hypothetical protein